MSNPNRLGSIKNNLIIYSLGIIFLMTILSVYSLTIMNRYKSEIETMFEKHIYLSEIEKTISDLDDDLLSYLSSKSSTRLNDFNIKSQQLSTLLDDDYKNIYSMEDLMMKNIYNLSQEYIDQADEAISYKRQRNVSNYYASYENSKKIKSYLYSYIDNLNSFQLTKNSKAYLELLSQIRLLQTITYIIVISLIIVSLIVVYLITSRMVRPFMHLSHAAEEIAKGNFETEDIIYISNIMY